MRTLGMSPSPPQNLAKTFVTKGGRAAKGSAHQLGIMPRLPPESGNPFVILVIVIVSVTDRRTATSTRAAVDHPTPSFSPYPHKLQRNLRRIRLRFGPVEPVLNGCWRCTVRIFSPVVMDKLIYELLPLPLVLRNRSAPQPPGTGVGI